jgi:hypothetical protein
VNSFFINIFFFLKVQMLIEFNKSKHFYVQKDKLIIS